MSSNMIYVCVSVCFMRVCLWFTSTAKAFLWGPKRLLSSFHFSYRIHSWFKEVWSLEEKNRKKSYKQPHSQRDKLKLFQKYLLSRSFTLFAAFRSHFVLSSLVENLFERARERGIFRSHFSSLFSARSQRKRENDRERKISLARTHKEGFCMARSFAVLLFALVWVWFCFYSYWVGLKN